MDIHGDHGGACARVARAQAPALKLCSGAGAARIAGARADAVTPDARHAVGECLGAHGEGLARVPAGRVHAEAPAAVSRLVAAGGGHGADRCGGLKRWSEAHLEQDLGGDGVLDGDEQPFLDRVSIKG